MYFRVIFVILCYYAVIVVNGLLTGVNQCFELVDFLKMSRECRF